MATVTREREELIARLMALSGRYDMTATERYEADSEAFYRETGYLSPGKDVPMAMGGQDERERRNAYDVWSAKRNQAQQAAILEAAAALASAPPAAPPEEWHGCKAGGVVCARYKPTGIGCAHNECDLASGVWSPAAPPEDAPSDGISGLYGYDPRQPYRPLPCQHCRTTHNPWAECPAASAAPTDPPRLRFGYLEQPCGCVQHNERCVANPRHTFARQSDPPGLVLSLDQQEVSWLVRNLSVCSAAEPHRIVSRLQQLLGVEGTVAAYDLSAPASPAPMPTIQVGDIVESTHADVARVETKMEAELWNDNRDLVVEVYRDPLWRRPAPMPTKGDES